MIDRARPELQPEARSRLYKIRIWLDPTRREKPRLGEEHDEVSILKHYSEAVRVRSGIIDLILDLRQAAASD